AITCGEIRNHQPAAAPIRRALPASSPQHPASAHKGIASHPPPEGHCPQAAEETCLRRSPSHPAEGPWIWANRSASRRRRSASTAARYSGGLACGGGGGDTYWETAVASWIPSS